MIDLYQGTLGHKYNVDDIKSELIKYLIKTEEDLSYGVVEKYSKVIFITGRNELEKNIKTFYHPIIFEHSGNTYIAMDVRLFSKQKINPDDNILDIIKDPNNGKLAIYRTILTKLFLDKNLKFLLAIDKQVFKMFDSVITTLYRNALMSPDVTPYVSLTCNYHYQTYEDRRIEPKEFERIIYDYIRTQINMIDRGLIKRIENALVTNEIPNPSKTIGDLVEVSKFIGANTRVEKMTTDVLSTILGRSMIFLNSFELGIAFVESKANTIAILTTLLENSFNRKSIMYKAIDLRKRFIDPNSFLRTMQRVINENILKG